jgi:hypothetical protein
VAGSRERCAQFRVDWVPPRFSDERAIALHDGCSSYVKRGMTAGATPTVGREAMGPRARVGAPGVVGVGGA